VTAVDGVDAWEQWNRRRFALVLTDCQMPRVSGYELARRIRQAEATQRRPRTPLVACTAMVLESETRRCLDAGMDDVVFKPVDLQRLLATLQRWVPVPAAPPVARSSVDAALLVSTWGPDAAGIRSVIDSYVLSVREDQAALRAAVARQDLEGAWQHAHRMLGASRMVGAAGMAEACALVGAASRDGDLEAVEAALQALDAEQERMDLEFGRKAA
jgi:CheY-like chemotaxis protein/HPt (histidine-containing phosphotransfer) domain-containing protein